MMSLPNSYTVKPSAIPAYFDALLDAQPPERFSTRFLENLGFGSTNDRLLIGILKDLGFLNTDGTPQQRYFDFLDRSRSRYVLADGIRQAYGDLFAVNVKANELGAEDVKNKLRTLYKGAKSDGVLDRIGATFVALCEYADFTAPPAATPGETGPAVEKPAVEATNAADSTKKPDTQNLERHIRSVTQAVALD